MKALTVIFDMDGVILDSEWVYQEIERSMYKELNIPVSIEEHHRFMGTAEWAMWNYMKEKYQLSDSLEDLVSEERQRFITWLESSPGIPLNDGLIPLLKALKSENIPCWIASSSSADIIARVIRINKLESFYKGYVSGDDVSQSKPSPEIFLKTAKLAETDPANCMVIEDSENGVRAAVSAGMKVIGLNPGTEMNPGLSSSSKLISSLEDIDPDGIRQIMG